MTGSPGIQTRAVTLCLIALAPGAGTASAQLVRNAFPNLFFHQAVFLTSPPDSTDRIVVVQQNGRILVFPNDTAATQLDTMFDISASLSSSSGEEGLLGLAFDPDFTRNGFYYVDYTAPNPLRTVVRRFTRQTGVPPITDTSAGFPIIEINQPYTNHNGGMLAFGADSDLYVGMGDGGSGGDPLNNAQDHTTLLGKILRLDVRDTTATTHYVIPPDNPFAGNPNGYREEIWAYGLRNPWRFSFDPVSGQLWAGDVGQDTREEVDIIEKGRNYGWRIIEGTFCYNPPSGCDTTGLTFPIVDYDHTLGEAITGGYVYRGGAKPEWNGAYIYGDYSSGRLWMLRMSNGSLVLDSLLGQLPFNISSFGVDAHQELYVLAYSTSSGPSIYQLVPTHAVGVGTPPAAIAAKRFDLVQNFPNPFNPVTLIPYTITRSRENGVGSMEVKLVVYDILGREVAVLVNERKAPGSYEVSFDAAQLAGGVYFYRLTAGRSVATRKMILIR